MEETIELKINDSNQQSSSLITFTEILLMTISCACLVIFIQISLKKRKLDQLTKHIRGPKSYPIIGSAYLFRGTNEDILRKTIDLAHMYQPVSKTWLGNYLFFTLYEPRHLEIIFNHPKALAKHDLYKFIKPVVGEGLFSAPVHLWKKNRKLLSPTFNQKILNNFVSTFYEQAAILTDVLEKHTNKVLPIKQFVAKFSLDTVAKTAMGVELHEQSSDSQLGKMIDRITDIGFHRMYKIWYHPDFVFYNLPIGKEFCRHIHKFATYTQKVIEEQRILYRQYKAWCKEHPEAETEECTKLKTFLQLVFQLNEDDNLLSDKELSDEVKTFLIAGSDTTAIVLSFCLMMMGMHPEQQEKVYEEVMDVVGPDRAIQHDDLPKLKYVERFINETNRLFPVGPVVVRENLDDIDLGDYILPGGSATIITIIYTHRSEKFWPNPLKFDPDRFLPEEVAKRHPYSFVPFTAGPRNCIGKRYGMMVLKVALAHIARRFKIQTPYKSVEDIRLKQDLLLQPVEGHKVSLEARD